jgi:acetyl esterase/lipase
MDGLAQDLAGHGVAVWNLEYRRLGEAGGGYPGTFLDVGRAIDALRGIAQRHTLDLSHVVAVGHSAGGHLALWAAARPRLPQDSALVMPHPIPIAAAVSLAGIADLEAYRRSGPACGGAATIDALVGAGQRPAAKLYADTSPRALLPFGVPQLIVAGAYDAIVPPRFARLYAYAAGAAGDRADFVELPDSDHFALIDPASAAWRLLRGKILTLLR